MQLLSGTLCFSAHSLSASAFFRPYASFATRPKAAAAAWRSEDFRAVQQNPGEADRRAQRAWQGAKVPSCSFRGRRKGPHR